MIHLIDTAGDGSRAACGEMWVDVTYIKHDVTCPKCLTRLETADLKAVSNASAESTPKTLPTPTNGRYRKTCQQHERRRR